MSDSRVLLSEAVDRLTAHSSTPRLDAEIIMAHCLGLERTQLIAQPATSITPAVVDRFQSLVERRYKGEPIAYLVGHKEFWGRDFIVSPEVLVPRPESELVVELALTALKTLGRPAKIIELGTGAGVIGLTIAAEQPDCHVTLTDISPTALEVCRQNTSKLGLADRASCKIQDLLIGETGHYDLLVANLPYVPAYWLTQSEQSPDTRGLPFEPLISLTDGSEDGLDLMRRFFDQLAAWTDRPPLIILEHGDGQAAAITKIAQTKLPNTIVTENHDYAGLERVIVLSTT